MQYGPLGIGWFVVPVFYEFEVTVQLQRISPARPVTCGRHEISILDAWNQRGYRSRYAEMAVVVQANVLLMRQAPGRRSGPAELRFVDFIYIESILPVLR